MSFYTKYELMKLVHNGEPKTFQAKELATGRTVHLHLLSNIDIGRRTALIQELKNRRGSGHSPLQHGILDLDDSPDTPYAVTPELEPGVTLGDWLVRTGFVPPATAPPSPQPFAAAPAPPPVAASAPPPAAGPGEFTRMFMGSPAAASPAAPPLAAPPAHPPPAAASPAGPGEFTRMFMGAPAQAPPASAPPQWPPSATPPAAAPPPAGPGEFTRMFSGLPAQTPSSVPNAPPAPPSFAPPPGPVPMPGAPSFGAPPAAPYQQAPPPFMPPPAPAPGAPSFGAPPAAPYQQAPPPFMPPPAPTPGAPSFGAPPAAPYQQAPPPFMPPPAPTPGAPSFGGPPAAPSPPALSYAPPGAKPFDPLAAPPPESPRTGGFGPGAFSAAPPSSGARGYSSPPTSPAMKKDEPGEFTRFFAGPLGSNPLPVEDVERGAFTPPSMPQHKPFQGPSEFTRQFGPQGRASQAPPPPPSPLGGAPGPAPAGAGEVPAFNAGASYMPPSPRPLGAGATGLFSNPVSSGPLRPSGPAVAGPSEYTQIIGGANPFAASSRPTAPPPSAMNQPAGPAHTPATYAAPRQASSFPWLNIVIVVATAGGLALVLYAVYSFLKK